jgi:hypothetical protein
VGWVAGGEGVGARGGRRGDALSAVEGVMFGVGPAGFRGGGWLVWNGGQDACAGRVPWTVARAERGPSVSGAGGGVGGDTSGTRAGRGRSGARAERGEARDVRGVGSGGVCWRETGGWRSAAGDIVHACCSAASCSVFGQLRRIRGRTVDARGAADRLVRPPRVCDEGAAPRAAANSLSGEAERRWERANAVTAEPARAMALCGGGHLRYGGAGEGGWRSGMMCF